MRHLKSPWIPCRTKRSADSDRPSGNNMEITETSDPSAGSKCRGGDRRGMYMRQNIARRYWRRTLAGVLLTGLMAAFPATSLADTITTQTVFQGSGSMWGPGSSSVYDASFFYGKSWDVEGSGSSPNS
jgi:hypothetical protein